MTAGVPHLDLGVGGQIHADFGEYLARFTGRARAERRILVPVGRQSEHRPWEAGAQRADHQVVHACGVGYRLQVLTFGAGHAVREIELGDGRRRVDDDLLGEFRIGPGLHHDLLAVERCHLGLEVGEHLINGLRRDDTLLDQQGLQSGRLLGAGLLAVWRVGELAGHDSSSIGSK